MNPHEADLLVDIRDGVATLTMNRPERLNALSRSMIDAGLIRAAALFLGDQSRMAGNPLTQRAGKVPYNVPT